MDHAAPTLTAEFEALRKGVCRLIIKIRVGAPGMRGAAGALIWLAGALFAAAPAVAHPTSAELAGKFARGEYLDAAQQAENAASADDLAFAARAILAHCMTRHEEPDATLIDRASKDAEQALRIDPAHEEGKLQLAIALSLKSRSMEVMDAWRGGYGEKGRRLATEVLKADPANFYAHGFLAVWNVEVRRRGGSVGAAFIGASMKEARRHYLAATRLAPDDVGVHWQYGRALAALDARRHGREAADALDRALAARADDHVEQVMQERAQTLAEALKGDRRDAQKQARAML
jgi:tetratricopeptide (TPR) repeat protein